MRKRVIAIGISVLLFAMSIVSSIPVFALSAGGLQTTIASIIVSLMVQAGAAPVSTTFLDTLDASYGIESSIGTIEDCITSGLLTESGGTLVDTGLSTAIESASAYSDLGLGDIFATTADDVGVAVASGGTNLANTAINCGTLGTIGAYAGAAGIGVGIGILANKLIEKYKNNIVNSIPLQLEMDPNLSTYPYQAVVTYVTNQGGSLVRTYNFAGDTPIYQVLYDNAVGIYHLNPSSEDQNIVYTWKQGSEAWKSPVARKINKNSYKGFPFSYVPSNPRTMGSGLTFDTKADAIAYMEGVLNGTIEVKMPPSSDLIGIDGNLSYDADTESIPGVGDANPSNYDMVPIPMNVYREFANSANENTENGDVGEDQGDLMDDLLDLYLVEPSIIPDQGVEDPDYPSGDLTPDQPTIPDKPPVSSDDASTVIGSAVPADIRGVFPFCIPFDLYEIVKVLNVEGRKAPHITFTFPVGDGWEIDVDLSAYDSVAALLRTLELLVFIVGLAVATRSLIGAGG